MISKKVIQVMYKEIQVQSIKVKGKFIWERSHNSIIVVPPSERLHADPLYNNQRTYPCVTLLSVMPGLSSICSTYHDYPDPNYWLVMSSRLQRGGQARAYRRLWSRPRNQFLLEPPPRPAESSAANRPKKDYHGPKMRDWTAKQYHRSIIAKLHSSNISEWRQSTRLAQ